LSRICREIGQADIRLAYAQHPFPAQGQATETAHLIVGARADRHGSYVALTRAREQTHIYAATDELGLEDGQNELAALAERMNRSEPETPRSTGHSDTKQQSRPSRFSSDRSPSSSVPTRSRQT
jgi:hypothetical protein